MNDGIFKQGVAPRWLNVHSEVFCAITCPVLCCHKTEIKILSCFLID